MNYSHLGKSDLKISQISFGCMSLGEDHSENAVLLNKALDSGINFFDTADLYQQGENEITVGKAFKNKRQQIIIATKVGNQWRADGSGWDWNPSKAYILKAAEASLRRLQTDYIDLYQLHGGTIDDPIDETIDAFETLKKQGKIRYYGISSIRPNVIREYVNRSNIVSVMMQYSLLDRRPEESCLPLLQAENIGVLVRGALSKGKLINKPPLPYLDYSAEQIVLAKNTIAATSGEKRTAAQTALQFVLANPAVTSAVTGIRTMLHLDDILGVSRIESMSQQERDELIAVLPANKYAAHR